MLYRLTLFVKPCLKGAYRFNGVAKTPLSSSAPPGPTSCVFLQRALKRLYAREDFEVLESLGEGFFGDVYKVCVFHLFVRGNGTSFLYRNSSVCFL